MIEEEDEFSDLRKSVLCGQREGQPTNVGYNDFEFKLLLGRGTFGKVFLAELNQTKKLYAIKTIRKDVLLEYNQV